MRTDPRSATFRTQATAAIAFAAISGASLPSLAAVPLTPDTAAAIAVERHPLSRAAAKEVEGAEADGIVARSGWLPRLDFTEDYSRSTNPVFVFGAKLGQERFGASDFALDALNTPDPFTNAASRVGLTQSVWDGGMTSAARKAASLGLEAARASLARSRDEVAFAARKAFWDAVAARGFVEAARDAERAAAAHAELAGRLVEEGIAVPSDRMQAEVRLGEVRALRVRAEHGEGVALAALRRALGVPAGEELALAPPAVDPDGWRDAEPATPRADLIAFDARLGQAREGESMALAARLPRIGVAAQYEWNGADPFSATGNNWTAGAFVRIPLYDGCEARGRRARARADRERLEALREDLVAGIALQLESARADRAVAAERLRTARANVALAAEALRIVKDRYAEGLAPIVDLLAAEASATQARSAAVEAERDLAVAAAAVDLAAGEEESR